MAIIAEGGVLAIGIPVWSEYFDAQAPADATVIEVTAQQFMWNVRYPGVDGVFGRTDPKLVDDTANPLGLDRSDPAGKDDVVALNDITVPFGHAVHVRLRSKDVIHSFFLPNFRVKQDAVPGMTPEVVFFPTRTGHVRAGLRRAVRPGALPHAGIFSRGHCERIRSLAASAAGRIMSDERGFIRRYIFSTDHKVIGIQYIITGLVMALVGAALATLIRLQLGWPEHPGRCSPGCCLKATRAASWRRSSISLS